MKDNSKTLPYLLVLLLFSSCSIFQPLKEDNYTQRYSLPGTIPINDTLFCDLNEISNLNWIEYMNWMGRVYGGGSKEYEFCIPASFNYFDFGKCHINFLSEFYKYPALQKMPLIGVSQEQAKKYSKWRSDRVFEHLLIELGKLRYNPNQTPENCFTIVRYYKGELDSLVIGEKLEYYPSYTLPTIEERNVVLYLADSLYEKNYQVFGANTYEELKQQHPQVICDVSTCQNDTFVFPLPLYTDVIFIRTNVLYNVRGSVAEWLDNDNLIVGGSWKDTYQSIMEKDTIFCDFRNNYTGFRNVCRWKKWNN